MGHETPTGEPETLRAGDTWSWKRTFGDHPHDDGWSLEYILAGASGPIVLETSGVSGTSATYEVEESSDATEDHEPGTYRWIARAQKDGEGTFTLDEGVIQILPNIRDASLGGKTYNERVLEAVRDAIEGRISKDQEEIAIDGRSIRNIPIAELRSVEAEYSYRVWQERNPGKPNPVRKVKFV